jgi:hypothetical protein
MSHAEGFLRHWLSKLIAAENGLQVTSRSVRHDDRWSIHTATARTLESSGYARRGSEEWNRLYLTAEGRQRLRELTEAGEGA